MIFQGFLLATLTLGLNHPNMPQIEPVSSIFSPQGAPNTSEEDQKILVHRYLDAYCENNVEVMNAITTKNCHIGYLGDKRYSQLAMYTASNPTLSARLKSIHQAFDSFSYKIEKCVIGGGGAVYFVAFTMRQKDPYLGIGPSNQYVTLKSTLFFEFVDSRIHKIAEFSDELSFFKQMGYLPF
jgi:predicted ester cyclase